MNDKPCKICGAAKRYANTSWCFSCYRTREKAKKELKAQNKLERKLASKGYQKSLKKKMHGITWRLISEWVRRKDATTEGRNMCYTCGAISHWKELQAGHYKHGRLDFDERNLKPQCPRCNTYLSGHLDAYAEHLIKDYGVEWLEKLVKDAWAHQGYSIEEMKKIQLELKEKLSKL